ncbi:MAG: stage III sporulation protein AF [Lachnospiraceae bacterium]
MENLSLFVKNLVSVVIVISAIMNLTTGEKYAKYLRFVVGLMLILYAMSAIGSMSFDSGGKADFEMVSDSEEILAQTEEKRNEMIDQAVLASYGSSIEYALKASGYDVTKVNCFYEDNNMAVKFYVESTNNIAGIKKYINNFYHVDSSHIYGYTEAEDEGMGQ